MKGQTDNYLTHFVVYYLALKQVICFKGVALILNCKPQIIELLHLQFLGKMVWYNMLIVNTLTGGIESISGSKIKAE